MPHVRIPRWLPLRFGFRTFLVAIAVIALLMMFVGQELRRLHAETEVAKRIQELAEKYPPSVWIKYGQPRTTWLPRFLLNWFGVSEPLAVVSISLMSWSDPRQVTDDVLRLIPHMPQLRVLELSSSHLTDDDVRAIGGYPHLTELDITAYRGQPLSSRAFQNLARFPELQKLTALNVELDEAVFAECARSPDLSFLSLSGRGMSEGSFGALPKIKNLTTFYLRRTAISDRGLEQLGDCQGLRSLGLFDCSGHTPQGIEAFQRQNPDVEIFGLR